MVTSLQFTKLAAKLIIRGTWLLALGFACPFGLTAQPATELLRREIAQLVLYETAIDTIATPGFIVGIIDGKNDAILSFGKRNRNSADTIRSDDIFELGSVSKVLTASVCVNLENDGLVSMNRDIASFLPAEYTNSSGHEVTLEMLLAHLSGLPREPATVDEMGNPLKSRFKVRPEDILEAYRDLPASEEQSMLYSNVGYALVEAVLYGATGATFDDLLRTHLCETLHMDKTGAATPGPTVQGYGLDGNPETPCDYGYFSASGGIRSSMADMMKFTRYSLTEAPEELFVKRSTGMNKYLGTGLGWQIVYPKGKFVVHMHTGRSPGHSAFIGLARQTQTAVVILANSAAGTDDLGMEILRMMNRNWKRKK